MRRLRSDVQGISPVIATIILIAAAGVAAGAIMAYVGGLYVTTPRVVDARLEGAVYDWNENAGVENFKNANMEVAVVLTSGGLRDVLPVLGYGFTIGLSNPTTGWSKSVSGGAAGWTWPSLGTAGTATYTETIDNFAGNVGADATNDATLTIKVPVDSDGDVTVGSAITVSFTVESDAKTATGATKQWDEEHRISVVISGRDGVAKTGYDGAYLSGIAVG